MIMKFFNKFFIDRACEAGEGGDEILISSTAEFLCYSFNLTEKSFRIKNKNNMTPGPKHEGHVGKEIGFIFA